MLKATWESHDLNRTILTQRARILKKINLAWTLENFKFSLEIFNLAWKLQSRLKFSILILRIPHKNKGLVGGLAWNFQSRLKMSFVSISLENFNPGGRSWIFSRFGPSGESPDSRFRIADSVPLRFRLMSRATLLLIVCLGPSKESLQPSLEQQTLKGRKSKSEEIDRNLHELGSYIRRRTNVQQLTCNIDLSCSFLISFLLFCSPWAKTLGFKGESPFSKKVWKMCEKVWNDFAL